MRDKLEFKRITKTYGPFKALEDVSLEIRSGEFMTLLGPSGSGKTTILMIIAGFIEPTTGGVSLDGREITQLLPERRNFGLVFQGYALFPHLTVAQNVAYPLRVRKTSKEVTEQKVRETLDLIQLGHLAERYPRQLSGGQQQRVALARALVFSPELLLLDEPLSALDRALRKDLQRELKDIHNRVGTTFIYVTHDQEEALSMSDRIAILREGQIEQLGTPEELYENPATIFVANFLGKSNFLAAQITGRNGKELTYEVSGETFRLRRETLPDLPAEVSIALRPERLTVCNGADTGPANRIPGEIVKVSYFGQVYEVVVRTETAGDLMVTASLTGARPRIGERVWVGWSEDIGVPLAGRPRETDDAYAG
ncbi:MAG: ABC transporter ATP-binding protein [Methyloligellaceae bacterium]